MKYIYKITSPSGKIYIGQSKVSIEKTIKRYKKSESDQRNRPIVSAIKKYKWDNMLFEIVESNNQWSLQELDEREKFWITFYDSRNIGYNLAAGGKGIDSETARNNSLKHHASMTKEKKKIRSENCSKGQKRRFQNNPDSLETRKRKSNSHKKSYLIISPDGKEYITHNGLKEFAIEHKDMLNITYWQLFNAYRKDYQSKDVRLQKNTNMWQVKKINV